MEAKSFKNDLDVIVNNILNDYKNNRDIDALDVFNQPNKDTIIDITNKCLKILFPGYFRDTIYKYYGIENNLATIMEDVVYNLTKQLTFVLKYTDTFKDADSNTISSEAERISLSFLSKIPAIRAVLDTDLEAFYDGDPAAFNKDEIIYAYPGFKAISIFRLAHELYELKVPILPRIMTEYAHGETGIDINPGASIDKYFFIDHGTGIVIGETTVIGQHVKIYQGVTLGALSLRDGQRLKNTKRHPTIEDNVTIYSNASILGGETVIGHDSTIGGNTFITKSVEPGSFVSYRP